MGRFSIRLPSSDREYTEVKVFSGFRGRFRLEEREPEIAFIDQAALTLVLNGGGMVTLKPMSSKLAERDSDVVRIPWGDAIEIEFPLPEGISADEVKESRFAVTGYYVRYSNLSGRVGGVSATLFDRAGKSKMLTRATPVPARY